MSDRIVVSLDELYGDALLSLARAVGPRAYAVKIHDAYDAEGPGVVARLKEAGAKRVWVDAKLHDIPNTAKARARALRGAGADIISVHASGGVGMMRAAKEGAEGAEVYAVTVLTALSQDDAERIYGRSAEEAVRMLARLAKEAGVDGVVCSPQEVGVLAADPALAGLSFVTPGVRSPGGDLNDQKRVATPKEALLAGATRIVVGREVTQAPDPGAALAAIESGIA